jgi:hypothetical protein
LLSIPKIIMSESDKKGGKRTPSFRIEISGNDDKKT